MKNLITLICLCIAAFGANGQAGSLTVINNTGCDVYYIIRGNPAPSCSPLLSSSFIALAAGGIVNYPNAGALPGGAFAPGNYINGADLYTAVPACAVLTPISNAGETCSGYPLTASYLIYNSSCTFCRASNINAVWTPSVIAGGPATLTFN